MDGKDCLKELKKDTKLKEIPVIIYTTSSHERDKEETAKLGPPIFLPRRIPSVRCGKESPMRLK
jgi:CheY-like chemotaxis protein